MGKLLISLSILCLLILAAGTHYMPNDPVFWLASTAKFYQITRLIVVAMLSLQLLTSPPRHIWLRLLTGGVALTVITWTFRMSYISQMPALDTLAFLSASIAM